MAATQHEDEQPASAAGDGARRAYHLYREVVARAAQPAEEAPFDALAWRAKQGDRAARDELYITLKAWLLALARWALRTARARPSGRVAPEDVRQQLFVCFCALLAAWRPERGPF